MGKSTSTDIELGSIYAAVWRMIFTTRKNYDGNPTGELLVVLTIMILDKVGYRPTISELVELTGLQKSSVSRYVSRAIESGFMTEVVNPEDRRQRNLRPTAAGKKMGAEHEKKFLETMRLSKAALRGEGKRKEPAEDIRGVLLGIKGESLKQAR